MVYLKLLLFGLILTVGPVWSRSLRIACVGDSITRGSGASVIEKTSYPSFLQYLFHHKKFDPVVMNFGVSGATAQDTGDIVYHDTDQYWLSMDSKPDVVVIQLGTNDAKENNWNESRYIRQYSKLIRSYKQMSTNPAIFICIPPPLYRQVYTMKPEVINKALPRIVPAIALSTDSHIIDLFNQLGGSNLNMTFAFIDQSKPLKNPNDGCHPNDFGYLTIAHAVHDALHKHVPALKDRVQS